MPRSKHDSKLLSPKAKLSRSRLAIYAGLTALVGIVVVVVIFAATGSLAFEAESGTLAGPATVVSNSSASGGKAIKFGSGATPTPSPTPTSTPTAGWPGANNTGYQPTGVSLHSCSGNITATGTYDSCNFNGDVSIHANNVTISRSLINGQVVAGDGTQTGLVVSDTTINCGCGSNTTQTPPAVSFSNFTLLRDNIYNSGHGVQINDNATVKDSWIHDLCCSGNEAHADGIISNGGGNATVTHNTIDGEGAYMSAAIGLFGDFGPIAHWTISNNLLNTTGSYCLYGGDASSAKPYPTATYMVITGNHFGKKYSSKCGNFGPVAYFDFNTGNSWSGNVWDDGSGTINP